VGGVDIPQLAVHALNCVHVHIGVITSWMAPAGHPCDTVRMKYVSRVPRAPLDGLIDDLYYLEGAPPYCRLSLPPMPSAVLIVNLGAPFRISASSGGWRRSYRCLRPSCATGL